MQKRLVFSQKVSGVYSKLLLFHSRRSLCNWIQRRKLYQPVVVVKIRTRDVREKREKNANAERKNAKWTSRRRGGTETLVFIDEMEHVVVISRFVMNVFIPNYEFNFWTYFFYRLIAERKNAKWLIITYDRIFGIGSVSVIFSGFGEYSVSAEYLSDFTETEYLYFVSIWNFLQSNNWKLW